MKTEARKRTRKPGALAAVALGALAVVLTSGCAVGGAPVQGASAAAGAAECGTGGATALESVPVVVIAAPRTRSAPRPVAEGFVTLEFTVHADGSVSSARVIGSDPPGHFDRAALSAVEKWRFTPTCRDGKPVDEVGRITLRFGPDEE